MTFREAFTAALLADPTLSGLVGDRVYPGDLPDEEDPPPWVYYTVPESVPFAELGDVVDVRSEVEVHALGDTYAEAVAVLKAAVAVLQGLDGNGITSFEWLGSNEEAVDDGYHHSARFSVIHPYAEGTP